MEQLLTVQELHGQDRLQRHIHDSLRRQRHRRRHGRRLVFRQKPALTANDNRFIKLFNHIVVMSWVMLRTS